MSSFNCPKCGTFLHDIPGKGYITECVHFPIQDKLKALRRVLDHSKKCEIRFNDRDFQKGDIIVFCDLKGKETEYVAEITHVLHFPQGLQEGYVALSFYLLDQKENAK